MMTVCLFVNDQRESLRHKQRMNWLSERKREGWIFRENENYQKRVKTIKWQPYNMNGITSDHRQQFWKTCQPTKVNKFTTSFVFPSTSAFCPTDKLVPWRRIILAIHARTIRMINYLLPVYWHANKSVHGWMSYLFSRVRSTGPVLQSMQPCPLQEAESNITFVPWYSTSLGVDNKKIYFLDKHC